MQLDIFRLGASIEGHSYEIQPADGGNANPHVKMTWNEGGAIQTATFSKGYGMKLQFDQAINRTVSAKIYLCFPDDSKSCVAGIFEVIFYPPRGELVVHEIKVRRPVGLDGADLVFTFTSAFSLQPSTFRMAPSATWLPMRDCWPLS